LLFLRTHIGLNNSIKERKQVKDKRMSNELSIKEQIPEFIDTFLSTMNIKIPEGEELITKSIKRVFPDYQPPKNGLLYTLRYKNGKLENKYAHTVLNRLDINSNNIFIKHLAEELPTLKDIFMSREFENIYYSHESKLRKERATMSICHYAFKFHDEETLHRIKSGKRTSGTPCFYEKEKHTKKLEVCTDKEFIQHMKDGFRARVTRILPDGKKQYNMYSRTSKGVEDIVLVNSLNNQIIKSILNDKK